MNSSVTDNGAFEQFDVTRARLVASVRRAVTREQNLADRMETDMSVRLTRAHYHALQAVSRAKFALRDYDSHQAYIRRLA